MASTWRRFLPLTGPTPPYLRWHYTALSCLPTTSPGGRYDQVAVSVAVLLCAFTGLLPHHLPAFPYLPFAAAPLLQYHLQLPQTLSFGRRIAFAVPFTLRKRLRRTL